jgi:hypothetical protein
VAGRVSGTPCEAEYRHCRKSLDRMAEWPNGGRNDFDVRARVLNRTAKRLLCRPARS